MDQSIITFELMGHRTLYQEKGKNGSLIIKVNVRGEMERWRKGNNIIT